VVGARLRQLAPADDIDEVGFALALLVREGPVYGDTEVGHGYTAAGVAQLRVRYQASDKHDSV